MHKYAMIGYYPSEVSGQVYAVGNQGVSAKEAQRRAAEEGLELYQLFPLPGEGSGHQFYRRQEDGGYKQSRSREFAARLSGYVGRIIEKDEANE
jgi:hypothetical protein